MLFCILRMIFIMVKKQITNDRIRSHLCHQVISIQGVQVLKPKNITIATVTIRRIVTVAMVVIETRLRWYRCWSFRSA